MKRLILALMAVMLLAACAPNDEQIFDDAMDILKVDLAEKGFTGVDFPAYEMAEIKNTKDDQYKVTGMISHGDYGNEFYVKLMYDGKEVVNYEWYVYP